MHLEGANRDAAIDAEARLKGHSNYMIGTTGHSGVPTFRISAKSVIARSTPASILFTTARKACSSTISSSRPS